MSKSRRFWLGMTFSAVFSALMLYLVVHDVDWQAALAAIGSVRAVTIVAAMLLIGFALVARGFRWHYLMCHRVALPRSLNLTFIAFLLNNLLPFRAGELARIELVARGNTGVPRTTSLSVTVVERLIDLITVVFLFGLAVSGLPSTPPDLQRAVAVASVLSMILAAVVISVTTVFQERVLQLVDAFQRRFPASEKLALRARCESLLEGLSVVNTPKYLALTLFWNALAWLFLILGYFVVIDAMFTSPTWSEAILLVVAIALAITIPTTIASIGIIEGGAVLALTSQGYGYDVAFAVGLILHMVTIATYTIQGLLGMWSETLSFSAMAKNVVRIDVQPDT